MEENRNELNLVEVSKVTGKEFGKGLLKGFAIGLAPLAVFGAGALILKALTKDQIDESITVNFEEVDNNDEPEL